MRRKISIYLKQTDIGQSLVETALFLPILIFMLAGIVEVSNLLITQNRLTTASRIGAGFGASNYDRDNWADDLTGTAYDMGIVAINSVTETMSLDQNLWDVWSVRALTNNDGTDFSEFESAHVYGNNVVVPSAEWTTLEGNIRQSILESLQSACTSDPKTCAANLEVVASVPYHDTDTILGLNIWQWTGFKRIQGFTVMRVRPVVQASGCPILPIAVRYDVFSVYPSNWPPGMPLFEEFEDQDPVYLFPNVGEFQIPDPEEAPVYWNEETAPALKSSTFPRNTPGIPIWNTMDSVNEFRGTIFWARDLSDSGGFGWLSWRGEEDEVILAGSLEPPGNFIDPDPTDAIELGYAGSPADLNTTKPKTPEITGDGDGVLEAGLSLQEWVENGPGNVNSNDVKTILEGYVDDGTRVSLLVFDITNGLTGSNKEYRAYGFITVKLLGFKFGTNDKWILFEFLSSGINCGLPEYS